MTMVGAVFGAFLVLSLGAVPAMAEDDSPEDTVTQWTAAHPKEAAIWSALEYPKRLLVPTTFDCMDRYEDDSSFPLRKVIGCEQTALAREGERERRQDLAKRRVENHPHDDAGLPDWDGRAGAIKKWLGAVLGYRAALAADSRQDARGEIAKQRKYSAIGGVVDLEERNNAQQLIREADEELARLQQISKANAAKLLPRTDKRVAQVEKCVQESAGDDQDCFRILLLHLETEPSQ